MRAAFLCLGIAFMCFAPARAQDALLDQLTLEQRIAQLFVVHLFGPQLTEVGADFLTRWQPGGVVLIGENMGTPSEVAALVNSYQQVITQAGGLPLLVAVDQEPGPIAHLREGFTQWPTPALITATGQPDLAFAVGAASAVELRAVGVNLNLSPVADLETNPNNPIIVRRSFGSSPQMVAPILAAYVSGLQSGGVLAAAKHFPGHGATLEDSHTSLPVLDLNRERLNTVELIPFRAAIEAGVEAIMVAHIAFPALDPDANRPASLSPPIVTDLLRGELGYQGLILTDALDMDAIDTRYSYPDAVLMAFNAGVDMFLAAHVSLESQVAAIQAIAAAVRAGEISEARLDDSVRRVLDAKSRYSLLDWTPLDPATAETRIPLVEHAALIDTLFEAGVTVAYDSRGHLPVPQSRSVLVIYPGTRPAIPRECSLLRSDIRWMSVALRPTVDQIAAAVIEADRADQVIVFTENAGERAEQVALVQALPAQKVAVMALWSAYDLTRFSEISAYALTYSPDPSAIPAACAALLGSSRPPGQLSLDLTSTVRAAR